VDFVVVWIMSTKAFFFAVGTSFQDFFSLVLGIKPRVLAKYMLYH
jgi:hypothetical protein